MGMQTTACHRCGKRCEPAMLRQCDKCNDGTPIYYWPCRACGYDSNGAQCGKKSNCKNAIAYRRANG